MEKKTTKRQLHAKAKREAKAYAEHHGQLVEALEYLEECYKKTRTARDYYLAILDGQSDLIDKIDDEIWYDIKFGYIHL